MYILASPKGIIKNDVKFVVYSKRTVTLEGINSFQCIQNISTFLTYLSDTFNNKR